MTLNPHISPRGIYVHIPFCRKKCGYCSFYSLPEREHLLSAFIEAILSEARSYSGLSFKTLYLGGGTPGLLGPGNLRILMDGLNTIFNLKNLAESTIELNPDSTTADFLRTAKESGFNRLSIGVQSLSDDELAASGRLHTADQALDTIARAGEIGFQNLSVDVMAGLPHQNNTSLAETIRRLLKMNIHHLSLYCLSLENNSTMAEHPSEYLPTDDDQADLFELAAGQLKESGFLHYEISNFSRPGHRCRHNLNYWRGGEYLGLGPAAASHLTGERWKNRDDLDLYLQLPLNQLEEREKLNPAAKAAEEAMLRLRLLNEGLDPRIFATRFGNETVMSLTKRLTRMTAAGDLVTERNTFRLSPAKILVSNPILAQIVEPLSISSTCHES
ncbi:MAG: radical SAM family heme chaperone HemW [bacterium]|jgi:oxygen-independent coproporphyrinogen-3 oxidase|nr:radical SAM family heme chaperone HemW [bacterium]